MNRAPRGTGSYRIAPDSIIVHFTIRPGCRKITRFAFPRTGGVLDFPEVRLVDHIDREIVIPFDDYCLVALRECRSVPARFGLCTFRFV